MVKKEVWSAHAVPESVPALRSAVHSFARSAGFPDPPLADVRLAVSEALTNAIVHGSRNDAAGEIQVEAILGADSLSVVVRDSGAGYAPRTDSPGAGLGMPIIMNVAHRVEVRSAEPGTELRMTFLSA